MRTIQGQVNTMSLLVYEQFDAIITSMIWFARPADKGVSGSFFAIDLSGC
jgi:hypothetical protein